MPDGADRLLVGRHRRSVTVCQMDLGAAEVGALVGPVLSVPERAGLRHRL